MAPNAPNKFYWRIRRRNTPLLTQAPLFVANSCTREIRAVRVCNTLVMYHECKRNLHCPRPTTVAYDFGCLKQNLSGGFTISCCNTNRSRQSPRKWLFFSLLWISLKFFEWLEAYYATIWQKKIKNVRCMNFRLKLNVRTQFKLNVRICSGSLFSANKYLTFIWMCNVFLR